MSASLHRAREVADACAIVLGCVPTVDAYDATVLGPGGVIEGSKVAVYVHLGTTGLRHVRQLAAGLAEAGISLVDAPMSGGVERAVAGTLASMVAGARPALEAARPVIERYSARSSISGPSRAPPRRSSSSTTCCPLPIWRWPSKGCWPG